MVCHICGIDTKKTMNCKRCGGETCIYCMFTQSGLCSWCLDIVVDAEYERKKHEAYV